MDGRSRDHVGDVRDLVAAGMPGYQVANVVLLGEGLDHVAYEVNGALIVRCSKEPDPARRAASVDRDARLLAAVAGIAPLPVPEPRFVIPEQGCLAYAKVPGVPLLDMPQRGRLAHGASIAATLGDVLAALHAVPVGRMVNLVDTDDQPLAEWRREAAETYPSVAAHVPVAHRRPVEAFLGAPPPADGYAPAFSHNDLGIEHVLVDPETWTVTGVIDWSDAAIVDPAYDLGLVYRDLGPAALDAALGSYHSDISDLAMLRERAVFYARCSVIEDLAHGLGTGKATYVDKSLAAMAWLFPAPS
ncbi:MAG: putative phosphotransferase [uncultured Thermomicrobiales bacterium]|uniref:Putative phosphotransferase n=1 Tax=uncultured Thermomicrobiales bacterium TaxID=1645740 RepID=A0A6J4V0U3_9BACT|nr:MAG: putative phosphotransferase [uncultured Thermomicrobiales bacterium]